MTRYTVTAERSGEGWSLQCVEVPGAISQVAKLDEAAEAIREAIAFAAGVPEDTIRINLKPVLSRSVRDLLDASAKARRDAGRLTADAAALLHDDDLTNREVALILGISILRVEQLLKGSPGTLEGGNSSGWVRIQARSRRNDVWLGVEGLGKPKISGEPWYMPDGVTDVYPFITDWRPEKLPFPVWLAPYNGGKKYGDMLWTGGMGLKVVSTRFVEALRAADITGYRTFDVDVRSHTDLPVPEYVGFATDPFPGSDIQNICGQTVQNYVFIATQRAVEALRDHRVDQLDISSYTPE